MSSLEVILSTTSSPHPASTSSSDPAHPSRTNYAPIPSPSAPSAAAGPSSITLHSLPTSLLLSTFKPSFSLPASLSFVPSKAGEQGGIFAAQEGKPVLQYWAWGKGEVEKKLGLPERLSCWTVSPNGIWGAGGSSSGHIYLWELASGLLLTSHPAAYRSLTSLTFTSDSLLLLSTSLDSSITCYSVARLVSASQAGEVPEPWGTLGDHTLAVGGLVVGRGGWEDCRVFSWSVDGTVKQWSLNPPSLLTTFPLPPSQLPTCLTLDPLERFFHVATSLGEIYEVKLFRRRRELGGGLAGEGEMEAVGGGGVGSEGIKIGEDGGVGGKGKGRISLGVPITAMTLSLSQTHLISGSSTGEIYIHSLPSHQHLRTILHHAGSPISHLSTLLRPPDLAGHSTFTGAASKGGKDAWVSREVRTLERMRVGKGDREVGEVGIMLGESAAGARLPNKEWDELLGSLDILPPTLPVSSFGGVAQGVAAAAASPSMEGKMAEMEQEVEKLKKQLARAKEINDKMWKGVVGKTAPAQEGREGKRRKVEEEEESDEEEGEEGGDIEMID